MMTLVDLQNTTLYGATQVPGAAVSSNTNGLGVDLKDANIRTHLVVQLGALQTNAVVYLTVKESDDNTTFAACADTTNTNTGNLNTSNSNGIAILSFQRGKRYVRADLTISGTNANAILSALLIAQSKMSGSNNTGYSLAPQS